MQHKQSRNIETREQNLSVKRYQLSTPAGNIMLFSVSANDSIITRLCVMRKS